MSLADCLKKIPVNNADKKVIQSNVERLSGEGVETKQAEIQAVNEFVSSVDSDIDSLASTIEKQGGKVSKGGNPLKLAQSDGYKGDNLIEAIEWNRALEKFGKEGMTHEARMQRAKEQGFDIGRVYEHDPSYRVNNDIGKIKKIREGEDTIFDGLFSTEQEYYEDGDFYENSFFVKSKADHSEFNDKFYSTDNIKDILDEEIYGYKDLRIDEQEIINELITEELDNLYDLQHDSGELPLWITDLFGENDTGLIEWEIQRIRGAVAKHFGFNSVDMYDETGTSTLLLSGNGVRSIHAAFDPDFKDSSNLLAQGGYSQEELNFFKEQGLISEEELSNLESDENTNEKLSIETARTISGKAPRKNWVEDTAIKTAEGPAIVYRGAESPAKSVDFDNLGLSTGHPSASFGMWLTSEKSDAENYGDVTDHYLDIRNPKEYKDIPEFDSLDDYENLRDELIKQGHDGVVVDYRDISGPVHFVAFTPDTVLSAKSSTLSQSGKVDSSKMEKPTENLVVTHNLTEENILAAHDLGGLASPSIATIRTDVSDFDSYGEISLLADPSLLDSPKARTFDSDIYSPRQPRALYDVDLKKYNEFVDVVNSDNPVSGDLYYESLTEQSGPENFRRSTSVKYHWLRTVGKQPKIKKIKAPKEIKQASKLDELIPESKKMNKLAESYFRDIVNSNKESRFDLEDIYFNQDGTLKNDSLFEFFGKVRDYKNKNGIDMYQLRSDIDKKFRVKKTTNDFNDWSTETFNNLVNGKQIFKGFTPSGYRKYVPYNMENVLKEMNSKLRGGESFFYGAGSVRSAYSKELKKISDVKKARDKIISGEDFKEIKEESDKFFSDSLEKLKPFYKYDADSFGYIDDAGNAIMEGRKGLNEAFNMNEESQQIVDNIIDYLVNLPTSYFETKIQRKVGFDEFNVAVVPKGTNKKVLKILKDAGLKIKTYGEKKDRKAVISEQKNILFQNGGKIKLEKWFENSKVVDNKGNPLPVYHGSSSKLDDSFEFDYSRIGENGRSEGAGFYFTEDKKIAQGYGKQGSLLEVYLKIQKPIAYDQENFSRETIEKIIREAAELEAKNDEMDIEDGFLANFGDARYEGLESVISSASDMFSSNDTAVDFMGDMIGSGVSTEILNQAVNNVTGHDGFTSNGFSNEGKEKIWVAFFPNQVKSVDNKEFSDSNNIYKQDGDEDRGTFKPLGVNPNMESSIINLSKTSDLSSFLHESAHLFLDMEARYGATTDKLTADQQTILDFLEVDSFQDLIINDDGITDKQREAHEKWAETFEVYLREGKAPSNDLKAAFAAFKSWLTMIYKTLTDQRLTRANLTPEIKGVFDRLIASEAEIEELTSNPAYDQFFKSKKQSGMSDAEWKDYLEKVEKARNRTHESIDKKLLKELYRRKTKEWNSEKSGLIDQEIERLEKTPIYQLMEQLKSNPMDRNASRKIMGLPQPLTKEEKAKAAKVIDVENDSLLVAAARSGGLDLSVWEGEGVDPAVMKKSSAFNNKQVFGMPVFRKESGLTPDDLAEIANENGYGIDLSANDVLELVINEINGDKTYTPQGIEKIERDKYEGNADKKTNKLQLLLNRVTAKTGVDPYDYQDVFEFESVEKMFVELATTKPIKKQAKESAEQIMIDKYGDILNDGTIELEVREAVHNEEQAKLLLSELRALGRNKPAIDRDYLKAKAKEMISSMKFSELQPGKYYQAELRAAKKAISDPDNAYDHKVAQLANHYLYKLSVETKERMVKQRRYVRGLQTRKFSPKKVDPSYSSNITMLARSYEMRQNDPEKRDNVEKLINWMITQVEDDNDFINFDIYDKKLIDIITQKKMGLPVSYELPSFDDMSSAELEGLTNQLKHMRFLGGRLAAGKSEDMKSKRQAIADSIIKNSGEEIPPSLEESKWKKRGDFLKGIVYSHRRIGGIFETLDGFDPSGPMFDEYQKINDSSNKQLELTSKTSELMNEAFKDVLDLLSLKRKTTITKADGFPFKLSHRARFVLALNWGNEGNREALLNGYNNKYNDELTESDVIHMLSTMTEPEILALDKVWSAKEHLWPEMSAVEVRLKGVAPEKVEPSPFVINGIKLKGGHYRLHYRTDPNDSARTKITAERAFGDKIRISTASSLHARVGSGGRQVDLELNHLFQDLSEDIHYISYAEQADHLNTTFKGVDNPIVSAITNHYGQPYYDNLIETISSITQPQEAATGIWRIFKRVRSNLTYAYLAYSVRNVIQQPIAITNSFSQLGMGYTLKGALKFYSSPSKMKEAIRESSEFMKNRTSLVNREAREQLSKIDSIHPRLGAMKNMAFAPQTFMDSLIAFPTWIGAKEKYLDDNPMGSNQDANRFADEMVAKTIGSGLAKDVGSILNKNEATKQITFMGTFFNLTWNLHVENAQLLKRGKISGMEYARRVGWMAIAPAILAMYILDDVPEDDEDKITHALKEVGYYNMSSLFLVRDLASTMDGFTPSIPAYKAVEGTVRVTKEMKDLITGDEDLDAETVASILRGIQPLAPLPGSGQGARMLEGASDEKQDFWGVLVEGKERNK